MSFHPQIVTHTETYVAFDKNGHHFYASTYSTPEEPFADCFRLSEGFCNGPECVLCGKVVCEHCNPHFLTEVCPLNTDKDYQE